MGDMGAKLENALGSINEAVKPSDGGPGLVQKIDRLVSENQKNLTASVENLRQVTDKLNRSEGTLGRLLNDTTLHDDLVATVGEYRSGAAEAKEFVANAQSILDQVKAGRGALGALVFDQQAGDNLKVSIANLRDVSDRLSRGEGTLGKLLQDDSILQDAQAIMNKADRALEGMGDSGPITAVGALANGLF
jgi:phospholipid/cholesterol/gamma-HCH transport system substrate-binding protein